MPTTPKWSYFRLFLSLWVVANRLEGVRLGLSLQNGATDLSSEACYAKRPQQGSLLGIFDEMAMRFGYSLNPTAI
jgi:hypothetical protein